MEIIRSVCALVVSVTKAFCLMENVENISLSIHVECNCEILSFRSPFAIVGVSTTIAARYTYFCCILAREETNLKQVKRSYNPE